MISVSEAVQEMLLRALAKEREARYASAAEMSQALRIAGDLERLAIEQSTSTPQLEKMEDAAGLANPLIVSVPPSAAVPAPAQEPPTIVAQPDQPSQLDSQKDRSNKVGSASARDPS
jgi:hypothetical protein